MAVMHTRKYEDQNSLNAEGAELEARGGAPGGRGGAGRGHPGSPPGVAGSSPQRRGGPGAAAVPTCRRQALQKKSDRLNSYRRPQKIRVAVVLDPPLAARSFRRCRGASQHPRASRLVTSAHPGPLVYAARSVREALPAAESLARSSRRGAESRGEAAAPGRLRGARGQRGARLGPARSVTPAPRGPGDAPPRGRRGLAGRLLPPVGGRENRSPRSAQRPREEASLPRQRIFQDCAAAKGRPPSPPSPPSPLCALRSAARPPAASQRGFAPGTAVAPRGDPTCAAAGRGVQAGRAGSGCETARWFPSAPPGEPWSSARGAFIRARRRGLPGPRSTCPRPPPPPVSPRAEPSDTAEGTKATVAPGSRGAASAVPGGASRRAGRLQPPPGAPGRAPGSTTDPEKGPLEARAALRALTPACGRAPSEPRRCSARAPGRRPHRQRPGDAWPHCHRLGLISFFCVFTFSHPATTRPRARTHTLTRAVWTCSLVCTPAAAPFGKAARPRGTTVRGGREGPPSRETRCPREGPSAGGSSGRPRGRAGPAAAPGAPTARRREGRGWARAAARAADGRARVAERPQVPRAPPPLPSPPPPAARGSEALPPAPPPACGRGAQRAGRRRGSATVAAAAGLGRKRGLGRGGAAAPGEAQGAAAADPGRPRGGLGSGAPRAGQGTKRGMKETAQPNGSDLSLSGRQARRGADRPRTTRRRPWRLLPASRSAPPLILLSTYPNTNSPPPLQTHTVQTYPGLYKR
uniref:collagen alpha-1(I) chain-like n=1 Tax=Nyctereutes procyonoides TaxID=34880 RepID=UPI002444EF38|nr:collagen alpha-1(I) chain-like [Nyctereutes procyonoides]